MRVGGERELAALEAHLDAAAAGRGRAVLVVGEAGIGKSTLLDALLSLARARGVACAVGRAWELGGAPPCWPWTEIVRALAEDPALGSLELASRAGLSPLLAMDAPIPAAVDAGQTRFRLFDAVARALDDAARVRPLVIALEDLHAADATTVAMLHFVAQRAGASRILLLGTVREHARIDPEVESALARAARDAHELRPARLGPEAVEALVTAHGLDPALAGRVAELTDGLPLFVVEYLRLWAARGRPVDAPPRSVLATLSARLDALTPAARAVLGLASIAGRSIDLETLRALAAGADVEGAVDEARALALVEREADRVVLSHALLADALRAAMSSADRREAHLALAARTADASEATHHLFEAGAFAEAAAAAERGAARASALGAHDDAVGILGRAVARLPAGEALAATRVRLMARLSEALLHADRVAEAEAVALEAAERARAAGDARLIAIAGLAIGARIRPGERRAALIALLEEARARLPSTELALHARVSARLAGALQPSSDPEMPIAMALDAIAKARALGDAETLLDVLRDGGSALVSFADPDARALLDAELLELASARARPSERLRALLRLVFSCLERGDRDAAEGYAAAHAELARSEGRAEHALSALAIRAMFAIADGRFAEARAVQDDLQMLVSGATGGDVAARALLFQRLGLARAAGDEATLAALAPALRAVGLAQHPLYAEYLAAAVAGPSADPARCRELAPRLFMDPRCLEEAVWMSEVARAAGSVELARRIADGLRPRERFATFAGPAQYVIEPPATRGIGLALFTLGELDEADAMLERAERTVRAMRGRATLAWLHEDRAIVADARGRTDEARERRREALALARELGIALLERRLAAPGAPARRPRFELVREGSGVRLRSDRADALLRATRGLEMLAELVAREGEELDALALDGGTEAVDRGDAGELLDAKAIAAYRARVTSLRERIATREELGDRDGALALREELDAIARELARGTGLGGRARRAGVARERARVNVQRRIRAAIEQIERVDAPLAAHLAEAVRTGSTCAYRP